MKRFFTILFLALPLIGLWCGCTDGEDVLSTQQSQIRSFLESKHTPRLISEAASEESLDENPPFYSMAGDTVYRYIRNYYAEGRDALPQVEYGDMVQLTFRMYQFLNTEIVFYGSSVTMPYYSNDPRLEEAFMQSGLTPGSWSFDPLMVELGRTEILKGFELALVGCRERDTVEVYMTYNMAYGDKPIGTLPEKSPVAIFFTVDGVTKW